MEDDTVRHITKLCKTLREPWKLTFVKQLGHGAFGSVDLMRDNATNRRFAVKKEAISAVAQLPNEFNTYRHLLDATGNPMPGTPGVYMLWTHKMANQYWMVMQELGSSLDKHSARITKRDVLSWIWPKALAILAGIHRKDIIHRDIKPENFLTGSDGLDGHQLYLTDFGLSKRIRMHGEHIPFRTGKRFAGTTRYASRSAHHGEEQSCRDDLESLGYVMLFLFNRTLPWMGIKGATASERDAQVGALKDALSPEALCAKTPNQFLHYFRYVRSLQFGDMPDYQLLAGFITKPM